MLSSMSVIFPRRNPSKEIIATSTLLNERSDITLLSLSLLHLFLKNNDLLSISSLMSSPSPCRAYDVSLKLEKISVNQGRIGRIPKHIYMKKEKRKENAS